MECWIHQKKLLLDQINLPSKQVLLSSHQTHPLFSAQALHDANEWHWVLVLLVGADSVWGVCACGASAWGAVDATGGSKGALGASGASAQRSISERIQIEFSVDLSWGFKNIRDN